MLKKIFYPFTDWAWLKLTLVMIVMTGFSVSFLVVFFGSAFFRENQHDAAAHVSIGALMLALVVAFGSFVFVGYLKRVVRQPEVEPLKLPDFQAPVSLAKEGFLTVLGSALSTFVAEVLLFLPIMVCGGVVVGVRALFGKEAHAVVNTFFALGLAVTTLFYALALIVLILWISFFVPLLAVRYTYTRRFRSFFEFRWAWNAFTIAPLEYLARTMAWSILLVVITILTPLTAGMAWILGYIIGPFSTVNCAYLMGDYYHKYLND
jgi:hypothetical protein